jgi:hypothetical protein
MRKLSVALGAAAIAVVLAAGCLAADPNGGPRASGPADTAKPQHTPAVKVMPLDRYVFVLQPAKGMPSVLAPTFDRLTSQGFVAVPITIQADRGATAKALEKEVSRLIDAGTPASHITIIGWGATGDQLIATAERLDNGDVGYVLIDGCGDPNASYRQPLKGRFLSLAIPKPDGSGASCRSAFAARGSADGFTFEEVWVRPSPDGSKTIPMLMIAEAVNSWVHNDAGSDSDYDPR